MSDVTAFAFALHIVLGAVMLGWFVCGPWQTVVCDGVRQRLFELRDQLFDLASSGQMSFDDPAYRYLRGRINAQIRFAHKATIWRVLAIAPAAARFPKPPPLPATESGLGLELRRIMRRSDLLIGGSMWLRSPTLIALSLVAAIPVVWALLFKDQLPLLKRMYAQFSSTLTQEAMAEKNRRSAKLWQPSSFL